MTNIFSDQQEFMTLGQQTVLAHNPKQMELYRNLIKEEVIEFMNATRLNNEPLVNQVKEANDILVVISGWLHSVGINPEIAWQAVHENNLLKVTFPATKDENGKIQKSKEAIAGKPVMMARLNELVDKALGA